MSTEYQKLKNRIEELEGQVEAMQKLLILLVNLLGPDFCKQFSNIIAGSVIHHTSMPSLQATDAFNATLTRIMEDCVEPSFVGGNEDEHG